MVQLAVFILVLALVYAAKAVAVAKTHADLASKSATFSWASVRPEDEATAASWTVEEETVQHHSVVAAPSMYRRVSA